MSARNNNFMRLGSVVGIREDSLDLYCQLHANPWPEVQAEIAKAGITNYSIFLLREQNLLFSYSEYRGSDRARDAARMTESPAVQEWLKLCRPCQVPLLPTSQTRRWTDMEQVYF